MEKRWRYGAAACVLLVGMLAGCGDGSEDFEDVFDNSVSVVEPVDMSLPTAAPDLGGSEEIVMSYNTGQLTEEEEDAVLGTLKLLQQNLELADYVGEGIHMVCSEEWYDFMALRLYEGGRSYTLKRGETLLLSVQIGYAVDGSAFTNVFSQGEDGRVLLLKQEESRIWLLQTSVEEGRYNGAFDLWQIDGQTGEILREQGTYSGGVVVGEYVKSTGKTAEGEICGQTGRAFPMRLSRRNMMHRDRSQRHQPRNPLRSLQPDPRLVPQPDLPRDRRRLPLPRRRRNQLLLPLRYRRLRPLLCLRGIRIRSRSPLPPPHLRPLPRQRRRQPPLLPLRRCRILRLPAEIRMWNGRRI